MNIELIYDEGCPNVAAARRNMLRALNAAGLPMQWTEWNRSSSDAPEHVRRFASPTVLVNGLDVAGGEPQSSASACRLYRAPGGGYAGAPGEDLILHALGKTRATGAVRLLAVPGITLALLPKLACPACWPAYAALMSAVGLGFLLSARYLFAATILALLLVLGALAYGARKRRVYKPLLLGVAASLTILASKFAFDSNPALYTGVALLIGSSLWNGRSAVKRKEQLK